MLKPKVRKPWVRSGPEYQVKLSARLNPVNGVVLPSKLKPDQPPIRSRHGPGTIKACARVRTDRRNRKCPICGDWYPGPSAAKDHFISCVGRNGNPQGYYWDGALNDERRIGKEIAELYCSREEKKDEGSENLTSDGSSSHDPRTMSYEPSESRSQASSSCSLSPPPSLRHDRNDDIGASPLVGTRTYHGHERGVIETLDEELADSAVDSPQASKEGRAETISKATQVNISLWSRLSRCSYMPQSPPTKQPRDPQVYTSPLRLGNHDDNVKKAWVSATPTIAVQHESGANTIESNDHEYIPGGFNAMPIPPKTATPMQASPDRRTTSNAYSIPTPVTPGDFGAGRSCGPSPGNVMTPLTSTAGYTNRYRYLQPHSPPSGAKKRQMPSGPPPLLPSSKRPRISSRSALPSIEVDSLQVNAAAGPIRQSVEQGPQTSPALAEGSALILSRNGLRLGESMDGNHTGMRQSKGAGLKIDTKAAESAAPRMPTKESTSAEILFADYAKTHTEFRNEIDNLAQKLRNANKRADAAELRSREAENKVYQANNAGFNKLKLQGDNYQKEIQRHQTWNVSLQIRCHAFEQSIGRKNQEIEELKWALEQERQMSAVVRSGAAKTVEKSGFGPSLGRE